ncbi:MAG: RNA polymerase sigma factor SigY [Clostridium sp.]|nr:RNA polymerase sigma factor SigY [Clostridium sp.]
MNFEGRDEKSLIERYKNGDKIALEILIKNNCKKVEGYILKLTCNKSLAEDILQDTLVSAIKNIDKFELKAEFSTWLITIASNKYKDYLRKHKETEILLDVLPSTYSLENTIINKEEYNRVLNILKAMPSDKRNVFILKHYYGYSYEEISNMIGCPIGTVRSRLHYGIKEIVSRFKGGNK